MKPTQQTKAQVAATEGLRLVAGKGDTFKLLGRRGKVLTSYTSAELAGFSEDQWAEEVACWMVAV